VSYARRWRGSRYVSPVSAWLVMSCTAPLHAVRVLHGSRRRRRHASCLAAPGVPLRCVVGGAVVVAACDGDSPSLRACSRRLLRKPTGAPSPPLVPSDPAPGWTPGLASRRWAAPVVAPTVAACCASAVRRRPGEGGRSCAASRRLPIPIRARVSSLELDIGHNVLSLRVKRTLPLKVRPERSAGQYLPTACSHTFIMLSTAASSIPVNGDG
jgi:hypothetical protein